MRLLIGILKKNKDFEENLTSLDVKVNIIWAICKIKYTFARAHFLINKFINYEIKTQLKKVFYFIGFLSWSPINVWTNDHENKWKSY